MQSELTLAEAQLYARECLDRGREYARIVAWRAIVNGYDIGHSKCDQTNGYAVETVNASGPCVTLFHNGEIHQAEKALYVLDDGRDVTPYYVSGWNASGRFVILAPFPTNYDTNGERKVRADNLRPVDMGTWVLPVRRAFHVKVTRDIGQA